MKFALPKFLAIFIFILLGIIYSPRAYAAIIFQDDFNSNNDNQWTDISGSNVWNFQNGKYGATTGAGAYDTILNNSLPVHNYVLEYDYIALQGIDKNFDFRWSNNLTGYELHFNLHDGPNFLVKAGGPQPQGWPYSTNFVLENNQNYHIKIVLKDSRILFYIDNNKLFDVVDPDYHQLQNEQVGLRIGAGSNPPTEAYFDNVVVRDIEPGDIPNEDLDVPVLKQTSDPWQSQEYDSAHIWSPNDTRFYSYGCAVTSAAMVFNYFGIDTLPTGQVLDPGTLNTWLKTQTDGFVGDGLVNWLALSRLSKQWAAIHHPDSFDALEFTRVNETDNINKLQLSTDLTNKQPDILEEPGHFVVAKGINNTTFNINDPYYSRDTLNDGYANTFSALLRYRKSFTDLSYILLTIDPSINISVKDSNNNVVGQTFIQQPLVNDSTGNSVGNPLQIVYIPKPTDTKYTITLQGNTTKSYNLEDYLYDINGNVVKYTQKGTVGNNVPDVLTLQFNNQNNSQDKITRIVTFQSIIDDINEGKALGGIKTTTANNLIALINEIQKVRKIGGILIAKLKIDATIQYVNAQKGKGITKDEYDILLYDLTYLKSHL